MLLCVVVFHDIKDELKTKEEFFDVTDSLP